MASKKSGKRGSKRGKGGKGRRGKSRAVPVSPMSLASKLRGAFAEGLIDPKVLALSHQVAGIAAKNLAATKGERPEQKLVRATGKMLVAQQTQAKKKR